MNALESAGKTLIEMVRDESIGKSQDVLAGNIKSQQAQLIHQKLSHLEQPEKDAIIEFMRLSVDSTLHSLLWMVEESPELDLVVYCGDSKKYLSEESDGLSGELYGEDGWIEKYSNYPSTY